MYRQLADVLRSKIKSGELSPGDRLPSEASLAQEYGLARASVRAVIAVLRAEGLVTTERGFGTKVRQQPEREVITLRAGERAIARPATEEEARQLDIDHGVPVIVVNQGTDERIYPADRVELTIDAG
jgi:DNA-binding GntR family transcriptional regulator